MHDGEYDQNIGLPAMLLKGLELGLLDPSFLLIALHNCKKKKKISIMGSD